MKHSKELLLCTSAFSSESPKSSREHLSCFLPASACVIYTMKTVASVQISLWKIKPFSTLMHSAVWHWEVSHCVTLNSVNPVEMYNCKSVIMDALQVLWKDTLLSGVSLQLIVKQENRKGDDFNQVINIWAQKETRQRQGLQRPTKPSLVKGTLQGGWSKCPCILFQSVNETKYYKYRIKSHSIRGRNNRGKWGTAWEGGAYIWLYDCRKEDRIYI